MVAYYNTYFELHIIPFQLESFLFESLLVSLVLSVWILTNYNSTGSQFGYNVSNAANFRIAMLFEHKYLTFASLILI